MSLDLSWASLDSALASSLLQTLNKALASATRPDFLGPLTLTAFDFGTESPDVHLVDIGDVWREFMSDAWPAAPPVRAEEGVRAGVTRPNHRQVAHGSGQGLAKFAENNLPFAGGAAHTGSGTAPYPRVQTFRQYGEGTPLPAGTPAASAWDAASALGGGTQMHAPQYGGWQGAGLGVALPTPSSASARGGYFGHWRDQSSPVTSTLPPLPSSGRPQNWGRGSSFPAPGAEEEEAEGSAASLPSLQLHLSLDWSTTTLRLTLTTSLLINHPSPAFMALPLEITLTALVLQAGALVAFESNDTGKRVHICLIEEEREEPDEDAQMGAPPRTPLTAAGLGPPPSLGERLIPHLALESSVGQSDKHTLVNVGKVERFVQELIRKAVVDEVSRLISRKSVRAERDAADVEGACSASWRDLRVTGRVQL